jgi:hypothetical protein
VQHSISRANHICDVLIRGHKPDHSHDNDDDTTIEITVPVGTQEAVSRKSTTQKKNASLVTLDFPEKRVVKGDFNFDNPHLLDVNDRSHLPADRMVPPCESVAFVYVEVDVPEDAQSPQRSFTGDLSQLPPSPQLSAHHQRLDPNGRRWRSIVTTPGAPTTCKPPAHLLPAPVSPSAAAFVTSAAAASVDLLPPGPLH